MKNRGGRENTYSHTEELNDVAWFYWNTGIETAPLVVQKCYESLKHYYGSRVIALSESNIKDYIKLPESIMKKVEKRIISTAIYADLIRFYLLAAYGGTWFDATVLLTDRFPEEIKNSDFFVPQNTMGDIKNPARYAVWLMHAKKGNPTIRKIRNIAVAYWKENKHSPEYLQNNLIITSLLNTDVETANNIPYVDSNYCEYLVRKLGDPFNEEEFEWIKELSPIHKLTYKLDSQIAVGDTYYRHLFVNNNV